MIPVNRTYAPLQVFVDELARCGIEHAVTCPGSRNAPLLFTLVGERRIHSTSVIDERSAAFVALGIAKTSGRPVALTCTSGTAAANFLPALIEAREARVALIVLTADRPPELRDTGAGQAIDQLKLYGSAVKWFVEVGNHEPGRATAIHHRALACRAYLTAAGGRPGPVHLNFSLREPLAPIAEQLDAAPWEGRADGQPWVRLVEPAPTALGPLVTSLASAIAATPRGAIVCGETAEEVAAPAARLAAAAGWPLLAEPTSGARCGTHDRSHVVAHYDALLHDERFAAAHAPDLVIRIGDTPTSKPLRAWLSGGRQVVVDPHVAWHEPTRVAETIVAAAAVATCDQLAGELERAAHAPATDWIRSWRAADALVPAALDKVADPFAPTIYAALADALPPNATIWLSSSMPIRDVETFFPQVATPLRFLANRGANGIDGVVSSALGAALAGARVFLLIGELALLHDIGGLLAAKRHGVDLTIVCANNGGGGIFDFLPLAEHGDHRLYEEHIATPSEIDLARLAALVDLPHTLIKSASELRSILDATGLIEIPTGLIEIRTDRARDVELHRDLLADIARQLERSPHLSP